MGKLVGYKLKEDCKHYREVAFKIGGLFGDFKEDIHEIDFVKQNSCRYEQLKQAGVMHWFEEVYEEKYKKGDLVIAEIHGRPNWIGVYDRTEEKGVYLSEWTLSYDIKYKKQNGGMFDSVVRYATEEEKKQFYTGNTLNGKIAEIEGKKYKLTLIQ